MQWGAARRSLQLEKACTAVETQCNQRGINKEASLPVRPRVLVSENAPPKFRCHVSTRGSGSNPRLWALSLGDRLEKGREGTPETSVGAAGSVPLRHRLCPGQQLWPGKQGWGDRRGEAGVTALGLPTTWASKGLWSSLETQLLLKWQVTWGKRYQYVCPRLPWKTPTRLTHHHTLESWDLTGKGITNHSTPSQTGGCAAEAGEWFFFKVTQIPEGTLTFPCQFQLLN